MNTTLTADIAVLQQRQLAAPTDWTSFLAIRHIVREFSLLDPRACYLSQATDCADRERRLADWDQFERHNAMMAGDCC